MFLLLAQITAHLSIIPMVLWADGGHYLISFIVYFFTGCIGMSMTYHRLLAHGSWTAPGWFEIFGTLSAVIGLTGSSLAWCAVHREHHQKSDTPEDPHTPVHKRWWRVQFMSLLHRPKIRLMSHKLKDPFHKFVHSHYAGINLAYGSFLFLLDPFALVYGWLFPSAVLWNSGSAVNTVGHLFGYRNFKTKDNSKNNPVLALLTWGEGWHNNHHYRPQRSYFGVKWYEPDISGLMILLITGLRRWIKLPFPSRAVD